MHILVVKDEAYMQAAISSHEIPTLEATDSRPLTLVSYGITDIGRERSRNEDQFAIADLRRILRVQHSSIPQPESLLGDALGHLMVVADGMGGHRGGEVASAMAVVGIENLLLNTISWLCRLQGDGVLRELHEALQTTDRWVEQAATPDPGLRGMGTTLTVAYVVHNSLYVAHAGDSRCYLLRNGRLQRLTRDHTLVEAMLKEGAITAEEAAHHNMRNVVLNAVGGGTRGVEPEVHKHQLKADDIVMLCTDGLTGMMKDDEIAQMLAGDPAEACRKLVDEANARGGRDNITVVVGRFDQAPRNR